jgi:lipopolysaccharide transport system ATP-binding protein
MSSRRPAIVEIQNLTLKYELYHDKTSRLKEYVINRLARRRFVDKAKDELLALNNINITVKEGERVGFLGHNGAGKSTLLKVVSGILKPSKGRVRVEGAVQPLIEVGAGFHPEFSGRENIYLNGYMLGFTRKQIVQKEKEIIEFAELEKFIDVPVKYYSSGMGVRLAFATATSIDPDILVFDEMLSAGDAGFLEKAEKRMRDLVDRARIMILVSHDLDLVERMCQRVFVMDHGRVVFEGKAKEARQFYLNLVTHKNPEQQASL